MTQLTVKKIPAALRARLQAEADRSFRGIEQEVLHRLQKSFDSDDARMSSIHARWIYEALTSGEAKPLTEAEVDAALERGVKRANSRKQAIAA